MKYYIIAGEASGDLHGSNLIKALNKVDGSADIRCWGGDLMQSAGGVLIKHYRELAFMGFIEVLKNISEILRNIKFCKQDIQDYNPDVLILIDYPGFNLRIASWAKTRGIKVVYYISPQVWAWKANRAKMMKKCIDKMFVILPFEKKYFADRWNWEVAYVGHPLLEAIDEYREKDQLQLQYNKPVIAVLPGSRKQEIMKKLPEMLSVVKDFPDYQFVIAKAPGVEEKLYDQYISGYDNVAYVVNRTYDLLSIATAAMVTSGTATLETALFRVPQVVCYKGNQISYEIARRIIKVPFISLVNLIMNKKVVQELIQDELNYLRLKEALTKIIPGGKDRMQILLEYDQLKNLLASKNKASAMVADEIFRYICQH